MQITLGQQYNVGEKPTVTLYIYVSFRFHALVGALHLFLSSRPRTTTGLATTYITGHSTGIIVEARPVNNVKGTHT